MKFAKTFCNPGAYVEVVPAGLLVKVQYNQHGLIEKMYDGYEGHEELPKDVVVALQKYIPTTIPLSGGTTYVLGVFHSTTVPFECEGVIPECYKSSYFKLATDGNFFKFYAGTVESYAANFSGSLTIRNWLQMAGFNVLPGIVVPVHFTDATLQSALRFGSKDINYPYLAGFFVFEQDQCSWKPTNFKQLVVISTKEKMDTNGFIHSEIHSDKYDLIASYSTVVANDIQPNTSVLYDGIDVLAVKNNIDSVHRDPIAPLRQCPICGKTYKVPSRGAVICDDPNCMSRSYPRITHLLRILGLPELKYVDYLDLVKSHDLTMICDVFLLPQYKDLIPHVTLAEALEAGTPVEVCADPSFFVKFVNSCNKSVETVLYYLRNPHKVITELSINSLQCAAFMSWIQQPDNLLEITTILSSVLIKSDKSKFDGAPIFRGKHIVITGKFVRGSYEAIADILQSYSAEVYPSIDDVVPDYVITGSTYDSIDGKVISDARALNVPIYDENAFFQHFDIDDDLVRNLL